MLELLNQRNIMGFLRLMELDELEHVLREDHVRNKFMAGGADILTKLLTGDASFSIRTMYIEFENGNPGSVTEPGYVPGDGLEYYTGLVAPKDYLRVPLATNPVISSSDDSKYAGNQVTFFGITAGTAGVNGLPFSETAGSVAYGGALVASPVLGSPTADRIYARSYWTDRLYPKHDGRQIGIQWTVRVVAND